MDYIDAMFMRRASVYLERFKDVDSGLFNFRCPLCGDSTKDETKTRGYLIDKGETVVYHCHNCGSPEVKNLGKLIQFLSQSLYKEYRREKFLSLNKVSNIGHRDNKYKPDDVSEDDSTNDIHEELLFIDKENSTQSTLDKRKRASERLLKDCIPMSLLDDDHEAKKYLIGRKLHTSDINKLYYLSDINLLTNKIEKYKDKKFPKMDSILIPFIDFDGVINCIQLRMMDPKAKQRYLTLYLDEDRSKAIYGLNHVNRDKTVYACEGPFDSMFLDNGIAFAGSSQGNKIRYIKDYIKDVVFVYDPDYKTNVHVRRAIESVIDMGYSVVLYDDKYFNTDDDINDVIKRLNWTTKELMQYIKTRTFTGMMARLELAKLDKPIDNRPSPVPKQQSALQDRMQRALRRN